MTGASTSSTARTPTRTVPVVGPVELAPPP